MDASWKRMFRALDSLITTKITWFLKYFNVIFQDKMLSSMFYWCLKLFIWNMYMDYCCEGNSYHYIHVGKRNISGTQMTWRHGLTLKLRICNCTCSTTYPVCLSLHPVCRCGWGPPQGKRPSRPGSCGVYECVPWGHGFASLVFIVTRAPSQDLFSSFQQTRQSVRQMSEGLEAPLTLFSLFPRVPVFHHHPSHRSEGFWTCFLAVTLLRVLFTARHISPESACSMSDTDTHTQTHHAICYNHGNPMCTRHRGYF